MPGGPVGLANRDGAAVAIGLIVAMEELTQQIRELAQSGGRTTVQVRADGYVQDPAALLNAVIRKNRAFV
jgi:GTP:adenosylcobinamide-phosphate guanylyltransferase